MKRQKRTKFDISKFLTENKITEQSKLLNENKDVSSFTKDLKKKFKSNRDDVAKAVEWYAGSVYGYDLPNNLHRDDVKASHINAVIKSIEDADSDYAEKQIKALKKKMEN